MGRIKDLVIDLQNEYGYDLENLPEGFSMDEYLEMKSKEVRDMSENIKSKSKIMKEIADKLGIECEDIKLDNSSTYTEQLFCQTIKRK